MLVVEIPTTRTPPGSRAMGRARGCGACGPRVLGVAESRSTSSRSPSIRTAKAGTASASKPGSPFPVEAWYFQPCQGHTTYSPSRRPCPRGPPAWLHTAEIAPRRPPWLVTARRVRPTARGVTADVNPLTGPRSCHFAMAPPVSPARRRDGREEEGPHLLPLARRAAAEARQRQLGADPPLEVPRT